MTTSDDNFHDDLADTPHRRSDDMLEVTREPIRSIGRLISDRVTVVFLGMLIALGMLEFILLILALAALRNIGIWTALDPHTYALVTVGVALIGGVSFIGYIVSYIRSDKT